MGTETENNSNLNSGNLIVFFYKWRKPLLIVTIAAFLCSIAVSLIIQNKYKSTVVLFPSTTSSVSKAILNDNSKNTDILQLGDEDQADQMLQILNSDEIRVKIIEKYNLARHYDIGDDESYRLTKIQKEFEDNVTFERTKYMSVEISVLDHDADTAALIANDIAALLDTVNNRMKREVAYQALNILEVEIAKERLYIKELEDSLKVFSKMGIIDIGVQTERLTEQMATAILQGKNKAAEELNNKLQVLGSNASAFNDVRNEIWTEKKRLMFIRNKLRETKIDVEQSIQHKFIVNSAFAAEKKSYPIRWLIVVVSTFSSFLLTLILLLFVESIKSTTFK